MSFLNNLYKSIGGIRGKKYTGIISGGLPAGEKWGDMAYLKANDVSLYTNRAIGRRAEKVGQIEFEILNVQGEAIENDPLLNILNKPNHFFSGSDFWNLHQTYLDVLGNSFIWIESGREDVFSLKTIKGLHILRPDLVKPIIDGGKVVKYEYTTPDKTVEYAPEEIMHMFRPDPINPMQGVSLLKAGIHAIQTEQQIGAYHANILENGGKVEGVMKFVTERLTKSQLDELKEGYAKEHADARQAGRPMFIGGDAEYKNTALTPHEMAFMDAKKMTLEDIIIMTGVPKLLLGSVDDVQYSNADTSMRMFLRETVNPLLQSLVDTLQNKMGVEGKTISYVDPTPENIEQKLKQIENGIKNFYITPNEAREMSGLGLDPVEGGDKILVPFSLLPLGEERAAPAVAPTEEEEEKSFKKAGTHPLQNKDVREMWAKIAIKRADAREALFAKHLNNYLKGQEERILDMLQPTKTRVFRKKGLFDEVTDATLEIKVGHNELVPILTEMLKEAGDEAMRLVGSTYGFNLTSDIVGWLDSRANIFLQSITETTFTKLKGEFAASLEAGESRDELVDRIKTTYTNIGDGRANVIARTEVHNATQYASIEGYRQAGLTIKIWVAVGDVHTRDSHLSIDGQEKPLDMPFTNGLMFPGDPSGDAGEVINCRCVI